MISISRIEDEKEIVQKMIIIYCRGHKHGRELCTECSNLVKYSYEKLDKCKFGNKKPFCSKCQVHCYESKMREKIKKVMRYSGPRIFFHHPIIAIKHFVKK